MSGRTPAQEGGLSRCGIPCEAFAMYNVVGQLFQPYTFFCLLLALALVLLWRKRRESRLRLWLLTIPAVGLLLLSFPWVSYLALASLEWQFDRLEQRPADAQAIVVLAGEVKWVDSMRPWPELGLDTTSRCLEGARLYRQGSPCRIIVSGGTQYASGGGPSAAQLMRDFLVGIGVRPKDVIVEGSSQTTYENARECQKILEKRHLSRVVLVTEAYHMYRALGVFEKQGIDAVPAPCRFISTEFTWEITRFLPDGYAPQACKRVFHEWTGVLWYRLRGRM
jgi:uncharacterized SAM-binding protein YcdF (DUF218 family)